ncbi:amidohydrolase family protein [Inquilinus sp. NPDC058860]|uniref:amidohydrolase family protein n=1 Tax=Inquilinus sp. NPDC058860 TaxID=3346652 RepID=UPI003698FD49
MTAPVANYLPVRADWLALEPEAALEPDLAIIDAHHHLWDRPGWRFLMDDYLSEIAGSGHRIIASVFMQCQTGYDEGLAPHLRPISESAYVAEQAGRLAETAPALCAGIVGHADLRLGAAVEEVLLAHIEKGRGRFRGIRHITAWNADGTLMNPLSAGPPGLLEDATFREGFARLAPLGLGFDAWLFQPQLGELTALARDFPETTIVLDHLGGILGIGAYAGWRHELFRSWSRSIRELAACPNVVAKIGGLGMRINGFDFEKEPMPPGSTRLAEAWRPYIETAIETFGPARCMFESNAPVDRGSYTFTAGWNAFKRLTESMDPEDRMQLFAGTARRVYRV